MDFNEVNKVKCKEYYTSLGEKIMLYDYETSKQDMSYYQWKKEIMEVATKKQIRGVYFKREADITKDKKPYIDPEIVQRVEDHRAHPNRYGLNRHDQVQFENYKKEMIRWEVGCSEAINC